MASKNKVSKKELERENLRRQKEAEKLKEELLAKQKEEAEKEKRKLERNMEMRSKVDKFVQQSWVDQAAILLYDGKKKKKKSDSESEASAAVNNTNTSVKKERQNSHNTYDYLDDVWDETCDSSAAATSSLVNGNSWDGCNDHSNSNDKKQWSNNWSSSSNERQRKTSYNSSSREGKPKYNNNSKGQGKNKSGGNHHPRSQNYSQNQWSKRSQNNMPKPESCEEVAWQYRKDPNLVEAPVPDVNVWEERKAKKDSIEKMCPHNEREEEAMLRKAMELSRRQIAEDEKLRKIYKEYEKNLFDPGDLIASGWDKCAGDAVAHSDYEYSKTYSAEDDTEEANVSDCDNDDAVWGNVAPIETPIERNPQLHTSAKSYNTDSRYQVAEEYEEEEEVDDDQNASSHSESDGDYIHKNNAFVETIPKCKKSSEDEFHVKDTAVKSYPVSTYQQSPINPPTKRAQLALSKTFVKSKDDEDYSVSKLKSDATFTVKETAVEEPTWLDKSQSSAKENTASKSYKWGDGDHGEIKNMKSPVMQKDYTVPKQIDYNLKKSERLHSIAKENATSTSNRVHHYSDTWGDDDEIEYETGNQYIKPPIAQRGHTMPKELSRNFTDSFKEMDLLDEKPQSSNCDNHIKDSDNRFKHSENIQSKILSDVSVKDSMDNVKDWIEASSEHMNSGEKHDSSKLLLEGVQSNLSHKPELKYHSENAGASDSLIDRRLLSDNIPSPVYSQDTNQVPIEEIESNSQNWLNQGNSASTTNEQASFESLDKQPMANTFIPPQSYGGLPPNLAMQMGMATNPMMMQQQMFLCSHPYFLQQLQMLQVSLGMTVPAMASMIPPNPLIQLPVNHQAMPPASFHGGCAVPFPQNLVDSAGFPDLQEIPLARSSDFNASASFPPGLGGNAMMNNPGYHGHQQNTGFSMSASNDGSFEIPPPVPCVSNKFNFNSDDAVRRPKQKSTDLYPSKKL